MPEIRQQAHPAAVAGFGQPQQCVELAAQHRLEFISRRALIDHAPLVDHVLQAVAHPGIRCQPVAPGAAGLLVIALDVLGHVQVRNKTHIGLVNAHTKCDGGHHHDSVFTQKAVLVVLAHWRVQACVVGQRADTGLRQHLGNVLDFFARLAIHHTRLLRVFALDETQQLRGAIALLHDAVADVGPIETADKGARFFKLQALDDVGAGDGVGGGSKRNAGHAGKAFMQNRQRPVFRPKVMAPLAHAMDFIDGKQTQQAAFMQ